MILKMHHVNSENPVILSNDFYFMYRRPKFLEVLHTIREEMSREADYDVDLFAEMVRSGTQPSHGPQRVIRGFRTRAPRAETSNGKPAKHRQRKRSA